MGQAKHLVAAGTKRARQLTSGGGIRVIAKVHMTPEERERAEWNARVEARKQAKKGGAK